MSTADPLTDAQFAAVEEAMAQTELGRSFLDEFARKRSVVYAAQIMDVLADGLNSDRYRACPLLKQLVVAGRLGDKTGRGVYEY